jgi:4-hydroxyphenylpyruvate dioxygenase
MGHNYSLGDLEPTAEWYERMLDFHQFYSVDYNTMHTEFSALRSTIITDFDEKIRFAIAEPGEGKMRSHV